MIQFSNTRTQHSFTMIYFSGLVVCLLVLTAEAKVGYSSLPFCAEAKQCLLFDVICTTKDYEVRHYGSVKVAVTLVEASSLKDAMIGGFSRLVAYIGGSNDKGINLDPVAPGFMRVPHKNDMETVDYLIHLPLPEEFQQNPPTPTDDSVFFMDTIPATFYVASHVGWITDITDQAESKNLSRKLDLVGAKYVKGLHVTAFYNRPNPEGNMYNEVAFIAVGEPVCAED